MRTLRLNFLKILYHAKRLESLLEGYNQKKINVIGDRLLQELPVELHNELLEKNAGKCSLASLFR